MKTNNIITLAPLNTWQHFRNLKLHQHQKGSTTLLSSLHFKKQVAGTRKRATLLKLLAVQKWILKSHSSKLLFVKFTHIYKYQVAVQLVYLDFLRLDCTALVISVGGKEGHVQLRQLLIAVPFRQSTRMQADLSGALLALYQSKGLRRGIQCEEGLRLLWGEGTPWVLGPGNWGNVIQVAGGEAHVPRWKKWQDGESCFN